MLFTSERLLRVALMASVLSALPFPVMADSADSSAIPPIVLQGCAPNIRPATSSYGASYGEKFNGFDISFLNTSEKTAKLVLIRIGKTDFVKSGKFSPGAVIRWRLDAQSGSSGCSIRAVRFEDGSEWKASVDATPSPGASGTPSPSP
jgi:hypothetical protein